MKSHRLNDRILKQIPAAVKRLSLSFAVLAFVITVSAADVTIHDSIASLASSGTKSYTFTDPVTGATVIIAVGMSPYSADPNDVLTSLDGGTRVGVGNPLIGGDGNWVSNDEGIDFSASLVSASPLVVPGTIRFRLAGVGIRGFASTFSWDSSAGSSPFAAINTFESVQSLDSATALLEGTGYFGRLQGSSEFQLSNNGPHAGQSIVLNATFSALVPVDPRTNSWLTVYSGKYARVFTTDADKTSGNTSTTWSRGSVTQSAPAYSGVQELYSSANWVYLRTTGLGFHTMGPWYLNAARTTLFPNLPANTKSFYRIPRNPAVAGAKTLTGLGAIGYFTDGVAMFDSRDGYYWNGSAETQGAGTGYWNRDAYVNEGITFDPAYAHQEQSGMYHYHASPIALRYLLGDNVLYNSATKAYSENTANIDWQHSPILGWVRDGYPIYGPYGYSNPTNPMSGVRLMISGYQLRNGQNGTDDLASTGRTSIPQWAARAYNVASNQVGPAVSSTYPLGRYMEDNAYLGDLGRVQGVDFDLDEYNGRFCITPEFPQGTYAYFVSIEANGQPKYPYNIGRCFYGSPTGSSVTSLAETVITNFVAGPDIPVALGKPESNGGMVTLVWNAAEGGTYQVQSSSTLSNWTIKSGNILATNHTAQATVTPAASIEFYRVNRTALAAYDPVASATAGGITSISPTSGNRGTSVIAVITLSATATPSVPPISAPVNSVTIGSVAGTSVSRPTQHTIQATINIPAGTSTGPQTVTVVFPGPPSAPSETVTYTMANGFIIN